MELAQIYSWVFGKEHDLCQAVTMQDRRAELQSAGENAAQSPGEVQGVSGWPGVGVWVWVLPWPCDVGTSLKFNSKFKQRDIVFRGGHSEELLLFLFHEKSSDSFNGAAVRLKEGREGMGWHQEELD